MGKQEAISRQQFDDLKDLIQEEALITRRTIVKTSQKTDPQSIRRKVSEVERKAKHEQYMRRKYPAVNEAYKHYQEAYRQYKMIMRTVK
tara:strand:+ start:809 stop:1075 length:267 start_codon:yes stop_codon:yes gene_type:complete